MPKPTKDTRKLPSPAVSIAFLAFLPNFAVFCLKDFLLCNFYAARKICTMPSDGVVINQDLEKMVNTARLGIFVFGPFSPVDGMMMVGWCSLAFKVWLQLIAATFHPEYQPGHLNGPEMTEDKS